MKDFLGSEANFEVPLVEPKEGASGRECDRGRAKCLLPNEANPIFEHPPAQVRSRRREGELAWMGVCAAIPHLYPRGLGTFGLMVCKWLMGLGIEEKCLSDWGDGQGSRRMIGIDTKSICW